MTERNLHRDLMLLRSSLLQLRARVERTILEVAEVVLSLENERRGPFKPFSASPEGQGASASEGEPVAQNDPTGESEG